MGPLQRPDTQLQPVQQFHIISATAKDGLAQMDVGLDKAGDQCLPGGIHHFVRLFPVAVYFDNPVAFHIYLPGKDLAPLVHSHDQCIFE